MSRLLPLQFRPNAWHVQYTRMITTLRANTCTQGMEHTQKCESTLYELCDWMDTLSRRVGAGLIHEVRGNKMHAFEMVFDKRVEVY